MRVNEISAVRGPGLQAAWGIRMGRIESEERDKWSHMLSQYYVEDELEPEV